MESGPAGGDRRDQERGADQHHRVDEGQQHDRCDESPQHLGTLVPEPDADRRVRLLGFTYLTCRHPDLLRIKVTAIISTLRGGAVSSCVASLAAESPGRRNRFWN